VTADIDGRILQGSSRSFQGSSRSNRSLQRSSRSVQGSSRSSHSLQGSGDKDEKEEEINKVKPPCSYERRARPWEWLPCDWTRPETKEATSKTRHYSDTRALELVEAGSPVPTPQHRRVYREGVGSVDLRACRGCPASVFGGFSESPWNGGGAPQRPW
jgi:hypothetical protein